MTVGRREETCKEPREEGSEGDMKRPLSITALSTIAVQSGQTQIVVSVLKSGSSVHLQLVHVEPGLCEIGSNQEDNQTLIHEQKQLLGKLQKHEGEVLSSVQKKREEQRRQKQDIWTCGERRTQEEEEKEEGVYRAMENSLREGWVLLLRLLDKRLHALTLAADFYHTVHEFSAGIELLGDLKITPDKLNHAQLTYTSIRRDLLGKSLQLLGISSDLMKKLKELQKTEALQRQGHVLQEGDVTPESCECSWGPVRRLEQMVEALQEQRRTVDHEVKLQIQQAQEHTQPHEQEPGEGEDWSLSLDEILALNTKNRPSTSEIKFDLGSKPKNAKIPLELPQVFTHLRETEDDNSTSCSDLVSMSSNETLDRNSASNLSEEEELRINSRMGEREPTPKWEIEETQETSSENTSAKSLESIAEENEELKQEIKYEELINTEPESDTELDNSYSSNDDLEIRLEQQAEDVFIEKTINESPSNYAKKHSDTKLKLPLRSLPVFSLASLKLQPKLQETKDWIVNSTSDSSTKSELAQELQNKDFKGESFSNCDLSTRLTPKEFAIVESDNNDKTSTNLEEKNESQLDVLESNLHESQDGKLDMNFQKVTVSKIKQMSKENPTISDLNQELQTRFELRSRSLPIFSLVSKKLQPKLQENKDLLNININANETSTSSEEKQKTEATMGFATTNHSNHDTTVEKESKVVEEEIHEIEDTKELYRSSGLNEMEDTEIQSDQEPEVKSTEKSASEEISKSEIDTNESEWDEENFSERFKKLQSKWQEKDNYSTSHLGLKFEKIPNNSYKVKNVINDKLKEENILKSEETKPPEITVDVKCNVEDKTVKLQPPEEPSEEHLVHKMEINPKVETIVKVESTTIENYEFKLEHSRAEQKQEEAERILHLEEIHKLEASFDQLADKVCSWLDSCSSVLMVTSHPGPCFSEAHHSLTTHAHLQAQAQIAGEDAESMLQMLDQLQTLCSDSPGDCSVDRKLSARAEVILKDLSTVNTTIQTKLQLLQPYVVFLQTAEEVLVDFEHLKRTYADRPEVEEAAEEARWQTAVQKFLTAQELGNMYRSHLSKMKVPGLNPDSAIHAVIETMKRLKKSKDEVEELHRDYQKQMNKLQEDKKYCLKYRQRLGKTVTDLQSVSELLDSCTVIDLGSEQLTSRLRLQFTQARPHFTQLDAEANFITVNFETVRRLQQRLGVSETVTEEDVSALLDLHLRLKQKVEESESILELSSSLHLLNKQLEEILQSQPVTSDQSVCAEEKLNHLKEKKEQIHNLFNRASNLKMDICDGIRNSIVPGFRVEQLESRLRSLDTRRGVWLSEAAQSEEALLREMQTQALLKDIHQLRDSFKDLKKRFGNLRFNYLKRNDRSRNIKAARNQLQQMDLYEDKLQGLTSRLQTLTARVHLEQKEGGGARELEDLLNELRRQMGECERSIREHHKTLAMTCTLQEAMDEYQFWCEEASGTISRVGKFSTECRSSEAVSALYRQFEKFVWPTVPQQEERIGQITELATRLHGAEEGRRYIEKTVSKHSEMVTAIRKLSDGLLELEARLKLESLKQQQKDEEKVIKEDKRVESIKQKVAEVHQEKIKDQEKVRPEEQVDNRTVQEAAEMYELKETGHTPELTNKHDGREIPVRRHSFNKKPPLQKNRTQETDRQTTSSFCSTHTFSLSCSPLETNRQVYAIISQSQPAIPTQTPPSPRDTKREEKDLAADSPLYTEPLHPHPDALSEDSLSTDEYDCPSPDDISLPPLAETPESLVVPSDLEEGLCFSSQHSYRSHRESTDTNLHSVNRVRTESGTYFPSPVTIPISTQIQAEFSTTVRSITTEESSSTPAQGSPFVSNNIPAQTVQTAEPTLLVHTHKDKNPSQNVVFTTSTTQVSEELPNLCLDNSLPKSFPMYQSSTHQEIISLEVTNLSGTVERLEDFEKSQAGPILESAAANIEMTKCEIPSVGVPSKNESTTNSLSAVIDNEDVGHKPEPCNVRSYSNGQSMETVKYQDSSKDSHDEKAAVSLGSITTKTVKVTSTGLVQGVIKATSKETKSSHHKNDTEDLKLTMISDHEPNIDCKTELANQTEEFKKAPSPESFDKNFASNDPPQKLNVSSTQEPDSMNHSHPSNNTTSNTKQNQNQTSTQQCVHDSGIRAQLGERPLPEPETQALPEQANPHATPSLTTHELLLTPDQDPDICQPCTIREEIRLIPQIKGPPVPPQARDECARFTKPVSKATVMGGSPVTLEVEVAGQPEPTLTWCKDDTEEEELDAIAENQSCEEESVMDGALCEAWLTAGAKQDKNSTGDEDGEDRGLMAEVYDIIMTDWQTWFGTLCFLLWLLILIVV